MIARGSLSSMGLPPAPNAGGGWSPLNLVQPGDKLIWYDPSDLTTLFQDTGGTTPITADGQSVALHQDKGTDGHHRSQATGPSMPKYKTDGTLHRVLYDGSDDSLQASSFAWGSDKITICVGITKATDTPYQVVTEFSPSAGTNNGAFSVLATSGAGVANSDALNFTIRGTSIAAYDATTFAAGASYVMAMRGDISQSALADENRPEVNGATPTLISVGDANAGTGNFGTYALNFGRRNNASLPFNGSERQYVAINRILSDAEFAQLASFVAGKSGITF